MEGINQPKDEGVKATESVSRSLNKLQEMKSEVSSEIQKSITDKFLELDPASFDLYARTHEFEKEKYKFDKIEGLLVSSGEDGSDTFPHKPRPGIVIIKDGVFKFEGGRDFGAGKNDELGFIEHIGGEYWSKRKPFTQEDYLEYGKLCTARIDERKSLKPVKE
jgi:hypothetical protein